MKIRDLFEETRRALSANKVRSGLTVLGIIIGIASVVAMISIGQGAQTSIQSSIESLGSNILTIFPGVVSPGRGIISSGRGAAQTLKLGDVDVLKRIDGIARISPELQRRLQITAETGNNTNTNVIGVYPEYADVHNVSPDEGTFINDSQVRGLNRVAVLGPTVATDIFGVGDPLGKSVRIGGLNFKVVGVLKSKGGTGFFNPDDTLFVPLTTMQKMLAGVDYLTNIVIGASSKDAMPQIQSDATLLLSQKHKIGPENPDFSIISQEDILGTLNQITNTFTIFLASIAGISLVVGGIGIMNMMLTAVTERTREIGLRKAIGAKKRDISLQFLLEAVMLTFLGGVIGVAFGWIISFAVSKFAGISTQVSLSAIFLAFGVSAAIGIIFGWYPARKAAAMNPIDALRYE